jgi:hypothetical protein
MEKKPMATQTVRPNPAAHHGPGIAVTRTWVTVGLLAIALLAFELFNFGTTAHALTDLLGAVNIAGVRWATILAVALCAVDFAGLLRIFTPDRGGQQPRDLWYLMGAWLLAALMNALMTWWAVALTLAGRDFGHAVLPRDQVLMWVPFLVAVLVLLTRILFIGALTLAGERAGVRRGEAGEPARNPARLRPVLPRESVTTGYRPIETPTLTARPRRDR